MPEITLTEYVIVHQHLHICPKCFYKEVEVCKDYENNDCDGYRFCGDCTANFYVGWNKAHLPLEIGD